MKLDRGQWTSLVLFVLALSTAFAVIATRRSPTTSERAERAANLLPVWRRDELERVARDAPGGSWVLERGQGEAFTLRAPDPEPADGAAADRLIATLGFATPQRRMPFDDLERLGLAKPAVRLAIDMGAVKYRLSLGSEAPAPAGGHYVAVEGDLQPFVAVVKADVAALFRTSADDLRERALFGFASRDLKELVIERPTGDLRLTRGASSGFLIDGKLRASRDALDALFTALARLEATRFLPPAEAIRARGGSAERVIRAVPNEPATKPLLLELGGRCPSASGEIIVLVKGQRDRAACTPPDRLAALDVSAASLVDRTPFATRADEVETLRLERGSKRLVLTRNAGEFRLREPTDAKVELEVGNQRLERLVAAKAELVSEPDLAELGLAPATGRAIVTAVDDRDQRVDEVVELGRPRTDGSLPLRRLADGAVLALGKEAARAFSIDTTLLKSQDLLSFGLSELEELALSAPEPQLVRRSSSGFVLVEPDGFTHDGALTTDAVLALGSLRALSFAADADDGGFGLSPPELTARVRFGADGGTFERTLLVGRATAGGHFARLAPDPAVFIVERSVVERLSTLLIDRSPLSADPRVLKRVVFEARGRRHVLARQNGALAPEPGSALVPGVAAVLLEALSGLSPEAGLHTGDPRTGEGFAPPALAIVLEPSADEGTARTLSFGETSLFRGERVRYARSSSSQATFAVSEAKLRPFFDLF